MVIIALEEQIRFAKQHIPHRIAILLAPFDKDTPEPESPIHQAALHGSFVAFRSLMDFMGLKDDRKSQSPSLTTHNATNDDVSLCELRPASPKGCRSYGIRREFTCQYLSRHKQGGRAFDFKFPTSADRFASILRCLHVTSCAVEGAFLISILTPASSLCQFIAVEPTGIHFLGLFRKHSPLRRNLNSPDRRISSDEDPARS